MKNKVFSIVLGLIAIAVGVGYALAALEIIDSFTIFFKGWWTLFLIVPGFISLFNDRSNKVFAVFITALGIVLLLQQQGFFGEYFKKLIFPALLILFGLSLIIGAIVSGIKKNKSGPMAIIDESLPDYSVSFGQVKPDYSGKVFEGCSMDVTFGAGKLDLRDAAILKDVVIYVNTAFSGITIKLPQGCRVELQTSTSFGGVENKYISSAAPDAPVVRVYAAVSFGGVTIK